MPHDEHDEDESMLSAFDSMAPAIPFTVQRSPENSASAFIRSAEAAALLLSEHALIAPVGGPSFSLCIDRVCLFFIEAFVYVLLIQMRNIAFMI
jgi:hypothetical protein